jgi:hypothetical protein
MWSKLTKTQYIVMKGGAGGPDRPPRLGLARAYALYFTAAWAAASLAMGTRYGEQLT